MWPFIYSPIHHLIDMYIQICLIKTSIQGDALALILSIPFVSLVWGVITFLIAIVLYSFLGFQSTPSGMVVPISRTTFATTMIFSVIVMILLVVSMTFFRV